MFKIASYSNMLYLVASYDRYISQAVKIIYHEKVEKLGNSTFIHVQQKYLVVRHEIYMLTA